MYGGHYVTLHMLESQACPRITTAPYMLMLEHQH
jgi:hypothetical protein